MRATGGNHTNIGTFPGISSAIRLLAAQLLLVSVLGAALLTIRIGTASADTGDGALTHATLPATHKGSVIAILAEKAIARQQQVIDLNPDLPTPPTLRSAA